MMKVLGGGGTGGQGPAGGVACASEQVYSENTLGQRERPREAVE